MTTPTARAPGLDERARLADAVRHVLDLEGLRGAHLLEERAALGAVVLIDDDGGQVARVHVDEPEQDHLDHLKRDDRPDDAGHTHHVQELLVRERAERGPHGQFPC
jgi:hypothetical protein